MLLKKLCLILSYISLPFNVFSETLCMHLLGKSFLNVLKLMIIEDIVFQDRILYLSEVGVFSCSFSPSSEVKHP